jgi:hypothetical protein
VRHQGVVCPSILTLTRKEKELFIYRVTAPQTALNYIPPHKENELGLKKTKKPSDVTSSIKPLCSTYLSSSSV